MAVVALLGVWECMPAALSAQDARGVAKVLFRDGVTVLVENWTFRYQFAVSETPDIPTGFHFVALLTKRSSDLQLETRRTERGVTSSTPIIIPAGALRCIAYRWQTSPPGSDQLNEIAVVARDGSPTVFSPAVPLSPLDSFLTDKGYPYSKSLSLVGQVRDPGGRMNEFAWPITFSYSNDRKEQVETICFE
jgi:hypothetical protein